MAGETTGESASSWWDTPYFRSLTPFIRVENYTREGGSTNPRYRLEVLGSMPLEVLAWEQPCVECGESMHPFRARRAESKRGVSGHVYLAVACPLNQNVGCSRGTRAKDAYIAIREVIAQELRRG